MSSIAESSRRAGEEMSEMQKEQIIALSDENRDLSKAKRKNERKIRQLEAQIEQLTTDGVISQDDRKKIYEVESESERLNIMEETVNEFNKLFSVSNLSNDVNIISEEITKLRHISGATILCLGARIKHVNKNNLWAQEFSTFEEWCNNKLQMSYRTAHDYEEIVEYFADCARAQSDISNLSKAPSKVRPFIPLIKNKKIDNDHRQQLLHLVFDKLAEGYTKTQMEDLAKQMKKELLVHPEKKIVTWKIEMQSTIDDIKSKYKEGKRIKEIIWE